MFLNKLGMLFIYLSFLLTADVILAQRPELDDSYADEDFLGNADRFVEGQGVRMSNVKTVKSSYLNVETEVEVVVSGNPTRSSSGSRFQIIDTNSESAKQKPRSYGGMSFSQMAESTKRSSKTKKSIRYTFSDLANSTRQKNETVSTHNNRTLKRINLPTQ